MSDRGVAAYRAKWSPFQEKWKQEQGKTRRETDLYFPHKQNI